MQEARCAVLPNARRIPCNKGKMVGANTPG